ncbi:MAG TPA: glycosyl hydrolase, partial [Rhizomicrobium sp.]
MSNTVARSARLLPFLFLAWTMADPSFAADVSPSKDDLLAGFSQPPAEAKPRVWWHWMNGNITKEGIKKDLDWMKRIGIGGVDAIDAAIDSPQIVDKRLAYMTPEWKDAFLYAVKLADKYGMEFSIDSSPGWSVSGGPWVKPEQAMKKAVWSTTVLEGGKAFHGRLPQPPDNVGPIQNALFRGDPTPMPKTAATKFYRDAIVVAYKQPVDEPVVEEAASNGGNIDVAALTDDDLENGMTLKAPTQDSDVWISLKYARKTRIQGWTLGLLADRALGYAASLEASDNGKNWRHVADMPPGAVAVRLLLVQQTISFNPVTARYFRVVLKPAKPIPRSNRPLSAAAPGYDGAADTPPEPPRSYKLVQLQLRADATVHEFEMKALYATPIRDFYSLATTSEYAPGS